MHSFCELLTKAIHLTGNNDRFPHIYLNQKNHYFCTLLNRTSYRGIEIFIYFILLNRTIWNKKENEKQRIYLDLQNFSYTFASDTTMNFLVADFFDREISEE